MWLSRQNVLTLDKISSKLWLILTGKDKCMLKIADKQMKSVGIKKIKKLEKNKLIREIYKSFNETYWMFIKGVNYGKLWFRRKWSCII